MLKAALIAVLGLGFGAAAQAQATDDDTILGCQPSEIEVRHVTRDVGSFSRELGGQRYNFCPLTGRSDNPLIQTASDFLEGRRINMSGTPEGRTAAHILSHVAFDERLQESFISNAEEVQARGYGRGLLPRINNNLTESRRFRPID